MIDTHCHIDDPQYCSNEAGVFDSSVLDAFIASQREGGVERILVPGVDESSCQSVLDICSRYPNYLIPALGLHPEEVRSDYREVLSRIHEVVVSNSLCAIGEIGLDYHFSTEFKTEQQDAFRIQMQWARDLDLPIMLHARDATEDTLRIINEERSDSMTASSVCGRWKSGERLGVAHCFSGSYEVALAYIRAGFYLGIGGVLTFKNCKLFEALCPVGRPQIPLDYLVLETDAPYMAPAPYRGKRNESRWMSYVVERLAEIYNCEKSTIIEVTNANAKALFDIK